MDAPQESSPPSRRRLGILFSGGGRTLVNLQQAILDGRLDAQIAVAICNRETCAGIERARAHGITLEIVSHREHAEPEDFSAALTATLERYEVGTVVMAGFLRLWIIPERYRGAVLNIHPALLPAFGGRGCYGMRVHRAVHAAGVRFSGCTVHYATNEYDSGPILHQRIVPVAPEDSPEEIAARVFEQECIAYPEALAWHLEGRVRIEGQRTYIA